MNVATPPLPARAANTSPVFANTITSAPALPYNPLTSLGAYNNPFYSPGYSGYGNYFGDAFGGYINGTAAVINSQGQFLVYRAQANIMREQFRQAKLETQRRAFDEWLYERANAPTPEDNRERDLEENRRRSRNDPPLTEIWSAKALNDL